MLWDLVVWAEASFDCAARPAISACRYLRRICDYAAGKPWDYLVWTEVLGLLVPTTVAWSYCFSTGTDSSDARPGVANVRS